MSIGERGHRPAKQSRSQATLDRIIEAAEALLDGRPFDKISVDDIINRAEVSRSSFYARFDSKEALLPLLFARYADEARLALADALHLEGPAIPPDVVVERLTRSYLRFVRRFQVETSTFESTPMGPTQSDLMQEVVDGVVRLYLLSVDRADDADLAPRVEFAARSIAAVLLRAVGPPLRFATLVGFDDERLITELTAMASAYLDAAVAR